MRITKKLTIEELKEWWYKNIEHIKDDYIPEDIEFSEIKRYTDSDDYINILRLYGDDHLLILLSFFEHHENYETCGEIVKQIEMYNKQFDTDYKTNLGEM